jgi:alkaline phosphatase D
MLGSLSGALPAPIDAASESLSRGLAFHQLLKTSQYARLGSRYLVDANTYAVYAALLDRASGGQSENLLGARQREWFLKTLSESRTTFSIWCSEIVLMPRIVDMRGASALPQELQRRLMISAEDWGGFPNERDRLLRALFESGNAVILSGDLHCFFAGVLTDALEPSRKLVELTTSSVSSTTWLRAISSIAISDPSLPPSVAFAVSAVGSLLQDRDARPNPHLAFQDLERNGCSVIEVTAEALHATFHMIAPEALEAPRSSFPAGLEFTSERFRVRTDSRELERELEGVYFRWDSDQLAWVTV